MDSEFPDSVSILKIVELQLMYRGKVMCYATLSKPPNRFRKIQVHLGGVKLSKVMMSQVRFS